jgi:hypothetical protein
MQMHVGLLQMADCGPQKEDLQAKGEAYCRQAAAMGVDIRTLSSSLAQMARGVLSPLRHPSSWEG